MRQQHNKSSPAVGCFWPQRSHLGWGGDHQALQEEEAHQEDEGGRDLWAGGEAGEPEGWRGWWEKEEEGQGREEEEEEGGDPGAETQEEVLPPLPETLAASRDGPDLPSGTKGVVQNELAFALVLSPANFCVRF